MCSSAVEVLRLRTLQRWDVARPSTVAQRKSTCWSMGSPPCPPMGGMSLFPKVTGCLARRRWHL
eukprot:13068919-Alexandrium_andersonii.AAC.1